MSDTTDAGRACTVRQLGSLENEPFELPVGDRDDLSCGGPDCSEPVDDQLRLEIPGIQQGMAVPFCISGFCSVDCLRQFHDMLPLTDVPADESESPVRHTEIESFTLVIVHASHDGVCLQSFAGYHLDSVLKDVAEWAAENDYVGTLSDTQRILPDAPVKLGNVTISFDILEP